MALQKGNVSSVKVASSGVDKEKQELVQRIVQELKNSKKKSVHRGAEADKVISEVLSTEHTDNYNIHNHVFRVLKPTESKRKGSNRKGCNRRKCDDRKNKSLIENSFKIYNGFIQGNQPSEMDSFDDSAFNGDDFSISSSQRSWEEESIEIFLDEYADYTYDGSHDHIGSSKKKLNNRLRAHINDHEFEDYIDYVTMKKKNCGVPWSYRRQKGKGNKLKGITGKRLSCGIQATNMTNKVFGSSSDHHHQQLGQFDSVAVNDIVSSDGDFTEETPLLRSPYSDQNSHGSPLDEYCDFRHATCFSDLDPRHVGRTNKVSRKLDVKECKAQKESAHKTKNEIASIQESLSQKYSPKVFKELVGQSIVAQALCNAVTKGKIAPFYLFHGPRGTGKTSAGRLFGAAINCMADCNTRPCGSCNECSKSPEITELNAAISSVSTESMKVFLQSIRSSKPVSSYQVYIVDECQALAPEAWTVLLNGLGEKSGCAVFIMITTDAEKLPRIALSRCQKFHFSKLKDADIFAKLKMIAAAESIDIEEDALQLITAKAEGSLRDAETTLDQLSLLGMKVTKEMVHKLVGLVPDERLVNLLALALSGNTSDTVRSIREITESGVQPLVLLAQLASLITDILAGHCVQASWLQENTRNFRGHFSSRDESKSLLHALKILSDTEKQLKSSNDHTTWLTAALLQFAPDDLYLFSATPLLTGITQSPAALLGTMEKDKIVSERSSERHWLNDDQYDHYQFQFEVVSPETSGLKTQIHSSAGTSTNPFVLDLIPDFPDRKGLHHTRHSSSHSQKLDIIFEDQSAIEEDDSLHAQTLASLVNVNEAAQKELLSLPNTEEIWQKVLERIQSVHLKKLLQGRGKLLSVFVSEEHAVVHLNFKHSQDKEQAESYEMSLSNAFCEFFGFPVDVKIQLEHSADELKNSKCSADSSGSQRNMPHSKGKKILTYKSVRRQNTRAVRIIPRSHRRNRSACMPSKMSGPSKSPSDGLQLGFYDDEIFKECNIDQDSVNRNGGPQIKEPRNDEQFKNVHLQTEEWEINQRSSNSITQQAEGSVEAYSQDLLYDNVSSGRRNVIQGFKVDMSIMDAKDADLLHAQKSMSSEAHSRFSGLLCWNESHQEKQHKRKNRRVQFLLKFAPCTESSVILNATSTLPTAQKL